MSIRAAYFTLTGGYKAFLLYSTLYKASGFSDNVAEMQFRVTDYDDNEMKF